ncbi:hypothetical protein SAMN04487886_11016 [Clostridium sp. DSM 8431]|nr:hypothetical protein SAMN04487886_11016 [Clostridium sp. DSM 8431]
MFKLILILFFKLINTDYENLNFSKLSKLIDNDDLKSNLIAKKGSLTYGVKKITLKFKKKKQKLKKLTSTKKRIYLCIALKTFHSST